MRPRGRWMSLRIKNFRCLEFLLPAYSIAIAMLAAACSTASKVLPPSEPGPLGASSDACLENEVRTFGALEAALERLETSPPTTTDGRCGLASLLVQAGRLEEAEAELNGIMSVEPARVDAAILLTRLLKQAGRETEAEALLEQTAQIAPNHLHLRLLQTEELKGVDASAAFNAILEDHPESVDVLVAAAKARFRLAQELEDKAQAELDRALGLDSLYAPAHLLFADQEDGNDEVRREATARALAADSLSAEAHASLSGLLRSDGDLGGAYEESLVVLRLDPYNDSMHRRLGNGGSLVSWGRYPPLPDEEVPPDLAQILDQGDAHLLGRGFDQAEAAFRKALETYPDYAAALLGLGAVHYYRGEYQRALNQFLEVAWGHPGLGLAHFGVSQSKARLRDLEDPELQAAAERFREIPRPPEPERLRDVFPDFDRVDDDLQKIILLSVAPLSNYVRVLAEAGATYQLIPFHKRLWELPNKERNRGRRTFDLRLWDDVKGQGGFHSTAGEEWIRDVMYERFNVLAHEFMHQVHSMFTEEQQKEVERLYREAKRADRTLDSYADYNEWEYLAQAYEAFISPRKLPGIGGTGGHTRREVERLDPAVIPFLETMNSRESYRENEVVAFRQKIQSLTQEGDLEKAEAEAQGALGRYGESPELLSALSGVLRLQGEYRRAMEIDQRSVAQFPEELQGYQNLAEDYSLASHDHGRSAEVMAEFLDLDPGSDEAWLDLAGYAVGVGRTEDAGRALDRADSIIGRPNPESRYHSLRAELALLTGDTAAAMEAYEYTLRNISRGNIPAWTELAIAAMGEGELERAGTHLETARALNPDHPRVREVGALLLNVRGDAGAATDSLLALYQEDPRRIETLTVLVRILGKRDPEEAERFAEVGTLLFEDMAPVKWAYEGDRWVPHGHLSETSMSRFRAEVDRLRNRTEGGATGPARPPG